MPKMSNPGFNLFLDILRKLEELDIPYAIIGGFATTAEANFFFALIREIRG